MVRIKGTQVAIFLLSVTLLLSIPLRAQPPRVTLAPSDLGPADPSLKLGYITMMLKPSDDRQAELEKLLADQQDRSSPNYHRWLTPEQFGDRFGLAQSDYDAVVAWAESHGFHVEARARARNWVAFSGSAQDVQSVFQTQIRRYNVNGETRFANATEPRIPEEIRHLVRGIRGLSNLDAASPSPAPDYTNPQGLHFLSPEDWATIYDVAPLYKTGINGAGQRIGIIGRSDMTQSYIDAFRARFGLPPTKVEQHLAGADPGLTNAANEAILDLEWAGAIAPNATLVYIYANNFNDAAQAAVDQNLAPVMSQSFGTCEPQGTEGTRAIAQQANAQGITWLASSGDSGGAACDPHGFFNSTAGLVPASLGSAVAIPAAFPEVTAVGGTQFNEGTGNYWSTATDANGGSALSYMPEQVWNETGAGGILASGGGASIYFTKPAWQVAPGVPQDNARDVPDVSFSSAGNHDPYMVINSVGNSFAGGTSASSPSFAGVIALLNQYAVSKSLQSAPGLGNINPELYRLASATTNVFHDITQGNNMVPCAQGSPNCTTGSLGFNAGPGYDQATGLGSIDVYNLVTQWNTVATSTTTTLVVNPGSITLGDSFQLTAAVAATGSTVPSGSITFSSGRTILGTGPLANVGGMAMATITISGPRIPVGNASLIATYSGDSIFNGSGGSATVSVTAPAAPGSAVTISITPSPARGGQFLKVTLTEEAGVGTTITGWTINGSDDFFRFVTDFGSTTLPAFGSLSSSFTSVAPPVGSIVRVYVFTGVDADGRTWSRTFNLTVGAPPGPPALSLASATPTAIQNPSADSSCQWRQQLILQEKSGLPIQLTSFLAGSADWTGQIQQLFGTTRLAPLGSLQASICWPGGSLPGPLTYEIDGMDQSGTPAQATLATSFASAPASPATLPITLSTSAQVETLTSSGPSQIATTSISLSLSDNTQPWTVSIIPSNQAVQWLTVTPKSGTGSGKVSISAGSAGLTNGVYNATLVFQSPNAVPQFIEVPVVFLIGASSAMTIGGVANGASFQQGFAPGMIVSVFGSQLAASTQQASSLPLPLALGGASATVNGIPAPFYYASSGQLNVQIPYEAGSGTAVLGVNNNGQVASYIFTITPAAPGIFTDSAGVAVPIPQAKRGDTVVIFITGEGLVSSTLATGATPFVATPLALLPQPALPLTVTVGSATASIAFAGIPPGLAGVTQVNFVIPNSVSTGTQPVVVTVGGVASQAGNITVTQ